MESFHFLEVVLEGVLQGSWQDGNAVLAAHSVSNYDLAVTEVDVFNAKPETLGQSDNWMDRSRANDFLIVSMSAMCAARSSRC